MSENIDAIEENDTHIIEHVLVPVSPKAFPLLMGVEFWERFSYYSMNFLLVLFAAASVQNHGMGWSKIAAMQLAGIYGAAVFIFPLFGSYFADRLWGQKTCAILGAAIMAIGHYLLAIHSQPVFFGGLVLLAVGSGFFKSCIPAMISQIFEGQELKKSNSFSTYYMMINLGAIFAGIAAGSVEMKYGYHVAFAMAGVGMTIAFLTMVVGTKTVLQPIGNGTRKGNEESESRISLKKILKTSESARNKYKVYLFLLSFFLLQICLYFIITNGPLALFLQHNTNRFIGSFQVPVPWFQSLDATSTVIASLFWNIAFSYLALKKNKDVSVPFKVGGGLILLGVTFTIIAYGTFPMVHAQDKNILISMWPFVIFYILSNFASMLISPVVLYASNILVPKGTESFHTALYYVMIGIASYVASWIGALMFTIGAFYVFSGIAVLMIVMGITHFVYAKRLQDWAG